MMKHCTNYYMSVITENTLTVWGPDGSASSEGAHLPPTSPWRLDTFAQSQSDIAPQQEDLAKNFFCPANK